MFANLSLADAQTYLDSIAGKGFNLVLASLVEAGFATNGQGTNYNSDSAWTGTAFQSSLNAAYWDHVDAIIEYAAAKNITVLACPAYIGFNRGGEGWTTETDAASDAQMRTYGENIGNRLKNHPNLMWLIGHDAVPNATDLSRQHNMWLGISVDAGDTHLMTVGSAPGSSGYDDWSGWSSLADVDFDTAYEYDNIPSRTATAYSNGLPVLFVEGQYEDHPNWTDAGGRYQFAGSFTAGALAGYVSGHEGVWGFGQGLYEGDGVWSNDLDDAAYTDTARIAGILRGLSWSQMLPDTSDTFLTAGEESGTTQAAAVYDADAGAIVYMPDQRSITLDLTELTGSDFTVTRIDPTDGSETVLSTTASGSHVVAAQGTNAAGASDWLIAVNSNLALSVELHEGGAGVPSDYWSSFSVANSAGWSDPSFFPFSVFFQPYNDAAQYASYGVNVAMGVEESGTDMTVVTDHMFAIPQEAWTAQQSATSNANVVYETRRVSQIFNTVCFNAGIFARTN